jgi:hypothetical protein
MTTSCSASSTRSVDGGQTGETIGSTWDSELDVATDNLPDGDIAAYRVSTTDSFTTSIDEYSLTEVSSASPSPEPDDSGGNRLVLGALMALVVLTGVTALVVLFLRRRRISE